MLDISLWSWAALAVMAAGVVVALSNRFNATGSLAIANGIVFVLTILAPLRDTLPSWQGPQPVPPAFGGLSLLHAELSFDGPNLAHLHPLGFLQLFSSMFLHHDLLHIAGNMIFLVAFGLPFEQRIGARRFVFIYLVGGVIASLVQFALLPDGRGLGASGAISAIMGAFAAKYPRLVVPLPMPLLFLLVRIPVPVVMGVLIYLVLDLAEVISLHGDLHAAGIGYGAHIGGMAAGVLLAFAVLRRAEGSGRTGRVAVDLPKLAPFARDEATQKVLAHMQTNHDEPAVFQAWLDRFFRTATCPTCSHRVLPGRTGRIVCTQGHTFDVRSASARAP